MKKISYSGYRFPPEIIHQAIWLYLRFTLSLRDVEDLLAERGVAVSYETGLGPVLSYRSVGWGIPESANLKLIGGRLFEGLTSGSGSIAG